MGCGCNGGCLTDRDRRAICATCIWAESPDYWTCGMTHCTITGRPITFHASRSGTCPKGKHDGKHSRFFGIRTYGVFALNRLWLWLTEPNHPGYGTFTGCGCGVWLKDGYNRWTNKEPAHGTSSEKR